MHDPARRDEVAAARRRGGVSSTKLRALKGKRRRLDTHSGLSIFLNNVIHDVLEGKLDGDTAKVVIYGCSLMRQLNERDVERRLAEVERLLAQRRVG